MVAGLDPGLLRGRVFPADVDVGRRVVADEHRGEAYGAPSAATPWATSARTFWASDFPSMTVAVIPESLLPGRVLLSSDPY